MVVKPALKLQNHQIYSIERIGRSVLQYGSNTAGYRT